MDRLYEQMRVRYSEKKDSGPNNKREGQMPPKKTVSFKEEKKVNWFQRQLSGQTSQEDEPSDIVLATAIAAATYAINSTEEGSMDRKIPVDGLQTSLTKTKSKKDSIFTSGDSGRISRWFSGKEAPEDRGSVGEISMRKSEARDRKTLDNPIVSQAKPEKEVVTVPSIKKIPTFSDKYLNDAGSKRFADEKEKMSGQNASAIKKTPTLRTGSGKLNSTNSGHTETEADAWEKAELGKVQKRYGKTYSSIVDWEHRKKTKAKGRLERKEMELQQRRARAQREYNDEIARIDQIAAGARAVADEKRKNEESKIKKKANVIRTTGKAPRTCFFF